MEVLYGNVINGKSLREMFPMLKFIRLSDGFDVCGNIILTEKHLNSRELDTSGYYVSGGIKIYLYGEFYHDTIDYENIKYFYKATIPDNAKVHIDEDVIRTDKVYLSDRTPIQEHKLLKDQNACREILKTNSKMISLVNNMTEEDYIDIMNKDLSAMTYLKPEQKTYKMHLLIVSKNGYKYKDVPIEMRTDELKLAALKDTIHIFEEIDNPTEEMCELAISKSWTYLKEIDNPTEKMYKLALQDSYKALKLIKNPTEEMYNIALKQSDKAIKYIPNVTEEMCETMLKNNPRVLKYLKNQTYAKCLEAVKKDSEVIKYVQEKYQTRELCLIALEDNYKNIRHIINPTPECFFKTVEDYAYGIHYIDNQYLNFDLCLSLVMVNLNCLRKINNYYIEEKISKYYKKKFEIDLAKLFPRHLYRQCSHQFY